MWLIVLLVGHILCGFCPYSPTVNTDPTCTCDQIAPTHTCNKFQVCMVAPNMCISVGACVVNSGDDPASGAWGCICGNTAVCTPGQYCHYDDITYWCSTDVPGAGCEAPDPYLNEAGDGCVSSCPTHINEEGDQCVANCVNYVAENGVNCVASCPNYYINTVVRREAGECVTLEQCNARGPRFYPHESMECIECEVGCGECNSVTDCTACYGGYWLDLNGDCVDTATCEATTGYFPNEGDGTCAECVSDCLTCSVAGESGCGTCKSGAELLGRKTPTSCYCSKSSWGWDPASCRTDCDSKCDHTHGYCSAPGLCDICLGSYSGKNCKTDENSGGSTKHKKTKTKVPKTKGGASSSIGAFRRAAEVSTIRSACQNDQWTIVIDTDYQLQIWGAVAGCTHCTGASPDLVVTSGWTGLPDSVACTFDGLFVLTTDGVLYEMGIGTYSEFPAAIDTFTQVQTDVFDLKASYHAVYITKTTQTGGRYDVLAKGTNTYGSLGVNNIVDQTSFLAVDISTFPLGEYPMVTPLEFGVLFSFSGNDHFFSGKDHPSAGSDVMFPTSLDFSSAQESQLKNSDAIDFMGRVVVRDGTNTGCLVIVSGDRFYVSGTNCNTNSIASNGPYPYELTIAQYGDYNWEKVFQMDCGQICYVLSLDEATLDARIFVFGLGDAFENIDLDADCLTTSCTTLTRADATNSFSSVLPVVATQPSVITQDESVPFNVFDALESAKFKPSVQPNPDSGFLSGDILTIELAKPEIFQQMESQVTFLNSVSDTCNYPGTIGSSIWSFWNDAGVDYYKSELQWDLHRVNCGWESSSIGGYEVYSNTIAFVENFYLGMTNGEVETREEEFEMLVQVRFNENVFGTVSIDVGNGPFEYTVIIISKDLDLDTKEGSIVFKLILEYPNFVSDDDVITLSAYSAGAPAFYNPAGLPDVNTRGDQSCDSILGFCEESFEVAFTLADDFCANYVDGADVTYDVEFTTKCESGQETHEDCYNPAFVDNTFQLLSKIESICGQLEITVEPSLSCTAYEDWDYVVAATFEVDKYVYFKCESSVMAGETITSITIDDVYFDCNYLVDGDCEIFADTIDLYIDKAPIDTTIVIDDLSGSDGVNWAGFHFKLRNSLTKLQPGDSSTYPITIHAEVTYAGGARRSVGISYEPSGVDTVNLDVHYPSVHYFDPLFFNIAVLGCVFLMFGVCLSIGVLTAREMIKNMKKKPKKKVETDNEMVQDEEDAVIEKKKDIAEEEVKEEIVFGEKDEIPEEEGKI